MTDYRHPPIVDRHGRTWTYRGPGDLYVHDGMAWPEAAVYGGGLPSAEVLANPNYPPFCGICKGEQ